jgi:RNA polymerase sigma-70 factor (ECF subfamily)
MTDGELIELISRNNREAFDTVYNRYWEKLFLYIAKVIRDRDDAQDIVQEIFVSLWLRREELPRINSLSAYLFTAARYKGLSYIQANIHKSNYSESLSGFLTEQNYSPDQHQAAEELQSFINEGVASMPSKMRVVFSLSRTEGLSHKKIAEKLEISDKTVKKQISNALKHIRLKLASKNFLALLLLMLGI